MYVRVAQLRTWIGGRPLTNASGFFFQHDKFLYLVTARHVVIDQATRHFPDRLLVSLHKDAANLPQRNDLSVPLYHKGVPQWFQHPRFGRADVVAIAINDPHALSEHFVDTFNAADIVGSDQTLPLGQQVFILGFPLGFHDTFNNLPIVRSATIASSFSHPFKNEPYFLTDCRLHRGMSGSPVIYRPDPAPGAAPNTAPNWRLLGIHTSALDVSDRDPSQDERLALNMTWYASLLPEILPQ